MSFFSGLFGGGGGSSSPPKPKLSKTGKLAQSRLYETMSRALAGGGLIPPEIASRNLTEQIAGYRGGYEEAMGELPSYLRMIVPQKDVKVRSFAEESLSRGYYGAINELKEQERLRPYEEQQEAISGASSLLAQEKRISTDITGLYNQYSAQQAQAPTFGSMFAGGLGAAGGWMAAAQRYAQLMSSGTSYNQQGGGF